MFRNFKLPCTAASGNIICSLLSPPFGIEGNQIQTGIKSSLVPPVLQTTSISELKNRWSKQNNNVICSRNIHLEMQTVFTENIVIN